MLTARLVMISVFGVAIACLLGFVVSMWRAAAPSTLGGDSFGTRPRGHKAVFELMRALDQPIERSTLPPANLGDRLATLVFWGSDNALVDLEPAYLQEVTAWVRRGGRVLVAPRGRSREEDESREATRNNSPVKQRDLLASLGLPEVSLAQRSADGAAYPSRSEPEWVRRRRAAAVDDELLPWRRLPAVTPATQIKPRLSGNFSTWDSEVVTLQVPEATIALEFTGLKPTGQLDWTADTATKTLVASFRLGKGEVVVVAQPALFENEFLATADNSVLAAHLLAADGRVVIWDEFYHGLTIRGNPMALARRGPYALLLMCILAALALWTWRQAIVFGPPSPPGVIARRSLAEYLDAMANFLGRSKRTKAFMLAEVRDGTLWSWRARLGLHPGQESPTAVAAALARRRPESAAQLIEAVQSIDAALASNSNLSDAELITLLQRIPACH